MKGGKGGRPRKRAAGAVGRPAVKLGRPKPEADRRAAGGAPKKGSRRKPGYGGSSSSADE
jgi:hypothetical protein